MGALSALIIGFFSTIPTTAIFVLTVALISAPFVYAYIKSQKTKKS